MEFTPEQMRQILSALDALCAVRPASNQRRAERREHCGLLDILLRRADELPQRVTVALVDYSSAGVGFAAIEPMKLGEIFQVCLTLRDGGEVNVPCVVANIRPQDDGSLRVGAEFQQVLCDVHRTAFGRVDPEWITDLPLN